MSIVFMPYYILQAIEFARRSWEYFVLAKSLVKNFKKKLEFSQSIYVVPYVRLNLEWLIWQYRLMYRM